MAELLKPGSEREQADRIASALNEHFIVTKKPPIMGPRLAAQQRAAMDSSHEQAEMIAAIDGMAPGKADAARRHTHLDGDPRDSPMPISLARCVRNMS
jgi:hypothetical protein